MDRRTQLIDLTIALVGRRGYNGFTLKMLAECSGLSNPGVLHYFASKDILLLAVLDEIGKREVATYGRSQGRAAIGIALTGVPMQACLAALRVMMARIVENPGQARFLTALHMEATHPEHPAHAWFLDHEKQTQEFFMRLVAFCPDPHETADLLIALMHGLTLVWLKSDGAFNLVERWDKAIRTVLPDQNNDTHAARSANSGG
ncbi:TetR family transcriptional regulator [Sphingomonas sp. LH128]|nr:TetR family transcriptional regulator [Sphingomonas sp. LH128]